MAEVYLSCESTVVKLPGVIGAIEDEAQEVGVRAEINLAEARASTTHRKIKGPANLTNIDVEKAPDRVADWFVCLEAPNPIAIEYGHGPSGYFDPDKYGRVTKAPAGLYILTRAAGLDAKFVVPSMGRKVGKR